MYRPHIDPNTLASENPPPHKYLFQAYLYHYHLMFFTEHILQIVRLAIISSNRELMKLQKQIKLDEIVRLEKTRRYSQLWLPTIPLSSIFVWKHWEPTDAGLSGNDDEDPGRLLIVAA